MISKSTTVFLPFTPIFSFLCLRLASIAAELVYSSPLPRVFFSRFCSVPRALLCPVLQEVNEKTLRILRARILFNDFFAAFRQFDSPGPVFTLFTYFFALPVLVMSGPLLFRLRPPEFPFPRSPPVRLPISPSCSFEF